MGGGPCVIGAHVYVGAAGQSVGGRGPLGSDGVGSVESETKTKPSLNAPSTG